MHEDAVEYPGFSLNNLPGSIGIRIPDFFYIRKEYIKYLMIIKFLLHIVALTKVIIITKCC